MGHHAFRGCPYPKFYGWGLYLSKPFNPLTIIDDCFDIAYYWRMSPLEIAPVPLTEMRIFSDQLNRIFAAQQKARNRLNRSRNL